MSKEAINFLKNSWNFFIAQELWIDDKDSFWGFYIDENIVTYTSGNYKNNNINFFSDKRIYNNEKEIEEDLEIKINEKIKKNYNCFAISL